MEISKDTKFTLSTETLVTIGITLVTVTGFYFSLKAEVAQAMEQPAPVITREEYDLKDNAIRSEIMNNRDLIQKNFRKLETIEERLYELKK
tara:strand:+ start:606 stop:878 length:273 start_codon:yes stop_codon:yes gene_type:complete